MHSVNTSSRLGPKTISRRKRHAERDIKALARQQETSTHQSSHAIKNMPKQFFQSARDTISSFFSSSAVNNIELSYNAHKLISKKLIQEIQSYEINDGDPAVGVKLCKNILSNVVCGYLQRINGTEVTPFNPLIDSQFKIQNKFSGGAFNQTYLDGLNSYTLNVTLLGKMIAEAKKNDNASSTGRVLKVFNYFINTTFVPFVNMTNSTTSQFISSFTVTSITPNQSLVINESYTKFLDDFVHGRPSPSDNDSTIKGLTLDEASPLILIGGVIGLVSLVGCYFICKEERATPEEIQYWNEANAKSRGYSRVSKTRPPSSY